MKSLNDFSVPFFKSFQQSDLILGVQKPIFLLIFLVFVLISYLFGLIPGLIITAVFYIPCRILTGIDPDMISIALSSLIEPDYLEG